MSEEQLEVEVPNEIEEQKPVETQISEEKPSKKTLREDIQDQVRAAKDREADPETKPARKTKNPLELPKQERSIPSTQSSQPEEKPLNAPISLKGEEKAKWSELPKWAQETIIRRESEAEKKITAMDEERHFGKKIKEVVTPYTPLFAMSNTTPEQGIREMLNYAQILQTGTPQSKGLLLHQLAQRWGADMRFTPEAATQPQNQLSVLQQELQRTKEELARLPQTLKQQQSEAEIKTIIENFANDPKNIHYEKVKPAMAALLQGGIAQDMQDAYDKACFADPDIRSSILADQQKASEEKRKSELKAKADAARKAASSVTGSPGIKMSPNSNPKASLREELVANYRRATEH